MIGNRPLNIVAQDSQYCCAREIGLRTGEALIVRWLEHPATHEKSMTSREAAVAQLKDLGIALFPGRNRENLGAPVTEADFGRSMATDDQVEPVFNLPEVTSLLLDLTCVTDKTVARIGILRTSQD
jgi:hypothetical protein